MKINDWESYDVYDDDTKAKPQLKKMRQATVKRKDDQKRRQEKLNKQKLKSENYN